MRKPKGWLTLLVVVVLSIPKRNTPSKVMMNLGCIMSVDYFSNQKNFTISSRFFLSGRFGIRWSGAICCRSSTGNSGSVPFSSLVCHTSPFSPVRPWQSSSPCVARFCSRQAIHAGCRLRYWQE